MDKKFSTAIAGAVMLVCLNAGAAPAVKAGPADAQFKAIYTQEWKWRLSQKQEDGEDDDDSGVSPSLPRIDLATQNNRLAYWQGVMKKLDGIKEAAFRAGAHQLPGVQGADCRLHRRPAVPRI
jgi:hypothetical protein